MNRNIYTFLTGAVLHIPRARSVVTAWSVCVSVYLLVTRMCCAKSAEPIEMPFAGWFGWSQGRAQLWGVARPIQTHWDSLQWCMQQNGSFSS